MRKIYSIAFSLLLLATGFSLLPEDSSLVEATRGPTRGVGDWTMDTNISLASEASFIGEDAGDRSSLPVSGAGDVNGDGYDDILIGAAYNDDGGSDAGQIYLILGKASGWDMDIDLSNADASFIGKDDFDYSGWSASGAGDVNGDGYDDILIGASGDDDGGSSAGQTYLILGKASGWVMDTDLSNADASFWGEDANDQSGRSISGAGDVDGDGYDDILIGAPFNDDGGSNAGQTYLILGKPSEWAMDTDLSIADASFIGEDVNDYSGHSISGAGDVNGDGHDDILIGAPFNDDGGANAGQIYLINRTSLQMLTGVDASINDEAYGINISWGDSINDPYFYGIYRGTDTHSMYRLNTATDPWYVDIDVAEGVTYVYAVIVVCPLGGESPMAFTDPIQCNFSMNQKIANLQGDLDFMNSTMTSLLEDIWNIVDWSNGTLEMNLNDLWNIADYMNDTMQPKLDWLIDYVGRNNNDLIYSNRSYDSKLDWLTYYVGKNNNDPDYTTSTFSLGLTDLYGLVAENNNHIKYMNTTFDTKLDALIIQSMWLVSHIMDLEADLDGTNNTLHQELTSLAAQLTAQSDALQSFRDTLEINISSMLVLLNGISNDVSAMDNVTSNLTAILDIAADTNMDVDYLNGTVTTDLATIISIVGGNSNDLSYMNGSLDTIIAQVNLIRSDISGMDASIDADLALIIADLASHRSEFQAFDATYTTDIATLSALLNGLGTDLTTLDTQADAYFLETMALLSMMDLNITSLDASLTDLDSRITSTMQEILTDMEGYNDEMGARIDLLELELEADIMSLMLLIEGMNASLNEEISMLDSEMDSFRGDTISGLEGIATALEEAEVNLMGELDEINSLIDNIDTVTLPELRAKLDLLSLLVGENDEDIQALIADLQAQLDEYDDLITARLENITTILEALDDLEDIASDIDEIGTDLETLQTLEDSLSDVETEQSDTSSSVGLLTILVILLIILVLALLAFMVFSFNKKGKEENETVVSSKT